MDFLTGAFLVVGLRRSQGLVGTGGVESGGRKSHDRAGSFTGSQGAQRPGTVGATAGAMANGGFVEKGPLVGMYARQVDGRAVSLGLLCCDWLSCLICGLLGYRGD
mgnify:FL=1